MTIGPPAAADRPSCALPDHRGWNRSWNTVSEEWNTQVRGRIDGNQGVLPYKSTSPSPQSSGSGGARGDPAEWQKTTRSHPKSIKYGHQSSYPGRKEPPSSLSAQREDTTSGLRRFRSYFGTDSKLWNNSLRLDPR